MKWILCFSFLILSCANAATVDVPLTEDSTLNVTVPKQIVCPAPVQCVTCPPPPAPVTCPTPVVCATPPPSEWSKCADEGGTCSFTGTKLVRYGKDSKWIAKIVVGPVACKNDVFTDPAPTIRKQCEVSSVPVQPISSSPVAPNPTAPVATQGQLTVTEANKIIKGVKIANPTGDCVIVKAAGVQIIDSEIGPCGAKGVNLQASNFTMQNTYVHDTAREGLYNYKSDNLKLTGNRFENVSAGARFVESTKVLVEKNTFTNMLGDMKTPGAGMGNIVQFDKVKGAGNAIRCNTAINEETKSKVEDVISLYGSVGDTTSPIVVEFNRLKGGGPSGSSGGILLGDGGGAYQTARGNVAVNPGQYGIAVAGGQNTKMLNNKVFGEKKPWSNVGGYVWDQYNSSCANVQVDGNRYNWTNREGKPNGFWNANNCTNTTITNHQHNDATLTAAIFDQPIAECN